MHLGKNCFEILVVLIYKFGPLSAHIKQTVTVLHFDLTDELKCSVEISCQICTCIIFRGHSKIIKIFLEFERNMFRHVDDVAYV